ncbi:small GTP-binding protein [Tolypothrix sp. NIES-4075]|uniref:GTPase ObgE n=1 Tax=Tolypothrix sp. NIES-4075 TaxID=2005459 RepID=UPI000B5CBFB4|nr:GTPase ObgE [Tolypothrix sp. NIES-4075]GAX40860.1 small GTP-binding protein [Tolypothrix sp. NIES-4075]
MQFIDQANIEVEAGKGGDGIVAFRREKYVPAGGPSGGNGGRGGSVIFVAKENLQTLLDFRYNHRFQGENGGRGGPNNCTGANGKDLTVEVPCGTAIYDAESGELLADLIEQNQTFVVAKGGKGGLGNQHFLSNRNRAPEYALPGLPGEIKQLRLELKLLAEVGIIGLPNAGKSTLISALSAARPKIADYPFTTLIPNLGVVRKPTGDGTVFADIPGLIEGASGGAGLGHDFLRHIERTRVLLHLIDATSEDVIGEYKTIKKELQDYGRGLAERSLVLALNKIDAVDRETVDLEALAMQLNHLSFAPVFLISAVTGAGLQPMLQEVWRLLDELNVVQQVEVLG